MEDHKRQRQRKNRNTERPERNRQARNWKEVSMKRRGPRAKKPSAKNVHGSAGERQRNDETAPAVIPHEEEASIEVPKNEVS